MRPVILPLMGLPLVPMTVSCPADTKLFVRDTTATRKGHSAHNDVRPPWGQPFCRASRCSAERLAPWRPYVIVGGMTLPCRGCVTDKQLCVSRAAHCHRHERESH